MGLSDFFRKPNKQDPQEPKPCAGSAFPRPTPGRGENPSGKDQGVPSKSNGNSCGKDAGPSAAEYGGYLLFDSASNGTLFLVWSEREVTNAMAFFHPKKPVPGFKFKNNGGKQEIFRNLSSDKAKYYEGWCQFLKTAVEFGGECKLLAGAESAPLRVTVAFLCGTTVKKLEPTQALSTAGVVAVGCVPRGQRTFDVLTMQRDLFLGNARQSGAALTV